MKKRGVVLIFVVVILSIIIVSAIPQNNNQRVMVKFKERGVGVRVTSSEVSIDVSSDKIKHRFEDGFSAVLSEKEINNLKNNPSVESVEPVGMRHISLTQSVPLVNATPTWNLQVDGVNLTGEGETVCILDTGADFLHPDLTGKNLTCVIDCTGGSCVEDCSVSDDNGHGTHVAGIVGANGILKGVAPGVGIIAVKVCTADGGCRDDDIQGGLDWCIANASMFNISVISMSLGSGGNSSYCNADTLASRINSAVANNISVIVASGNDGSSTEIESPACVQNATAVGMTYDADVGGIIWGSPETCRDLTTSADQIVCSSNRNSLLDLFAPGALINSTYPGSTYLNTGGTSMATPHVAGAFAILREFKEKEKGIALTPQQIQDAFNTTGKQINDSGYSNLTYSRIDILSAVLSLDESAPVVSLVSPSDAGASFNNEVNFTCNATDIQLANLTLMVWNSTNSLVYENSSDASSNSLTISFNETLDDGDYVWNCYGEDNILNSGFATSNFSLSVAHVLTTLSSPSSIITSINSTELICNSSTDSSTHLSNVTFYLWNSTGALINISTVDISGTTNSSTFEYNITEEDTYYWNCLTVNNESTSVFAISNYTIVYDLTPPVVSLSSPSEGYSTFSTSVSFSYIVTEDNLANCSLIVDGSIVQTDDSPSNSEINSFSKTLAVGSYSWKINCTDGAGNERGSLTRSLTITSPPASSSPGGGGGGGATSTVYSITEEQLQTGVSRVLKKGDTIKFGLNNENHSLFVNEINSSRVKITISSNPQTFYLGVNETQKADLNNDNYYDLEVKLISLTAVYANVSVREISEEIPKRFISGEAVSDGVNENEKGAGERFSFSFDLKDWIILFLVIIIIALVLRFKNYLFKRAEIERDKAKTIKKLKN